MIGSGSIIIKNEQTSQELDKLGRTGDTPISLVLSFYSNSIEVRVFLSERDRHEITNGV